MLKGLTRMPGEKRGHPATDAWSYSYEVRNETQYYIIIIMDRSKKRLNSGMFKSLF